MKRTKLFNSNILRDCTIVMFSFAAIGIMALIAMNISFFNPVVHTMKDFSLTDVYYYVMQDYGRVDTSRVITIVDMTHLNNRSEIADVLEEIESMNPSVIGVDIIFEGEKNDTLANAKLKKLVSSHDNIVYSYRLTDYINDTLGYENDIHSFFTENTHVKEGFTNYSRHLYGGIKRECSLFTYLQGEKCQSFVHEVIKSYLGKEPNIEKEKVNINFRPTQFRVLSPDSLSYHPDWIKDHIVLYGATHAQEDMHYTPLGEMPGVELSAYSIQTILEQSEVKHINGFFTAVISFLLVLITYRGRKSYLTWAKARKNEWLCFFLTTTFIVGLLLFIWSAILVWIGFILFMVTDYSLSLGWTMAAIPFLGGAGEFYGLTVKWYIGGFTLS